MNDATTDARPEASDRVALYPRHDETFPLLTAEEIDRLRRFGTERHYRAGEALFIAGEPAPGMFVVLDGMVTITQRDGFGRRQPVVEQGPGQFLAEAGTLSGRPALVDGHAEGDVTAILIPPPGLRALLVAEATLGERITRALILRRVQLIQAGHGGPLIVGNPDDADVIRLATFLRRSALPHKIADPAVDPAAAGLLSHCRAGGTVLPVVIVPTGEALLNPTIGELGRALGMTGRAPGREMFDVAVVGAGPAGPLRRRLRRLRGPVGRRSRRPGLRRPGRGQRPDRELSRLPDRHHRPGADRPRLRAGREVRRRDHLPGAGQRARLPRPRGPLPPRARRRRQRDRPHRGHRQRRPLPPAGDPRHRALRGPRRLVLGLADRGAALLRAPRWRWSAAATPPARPRSTSPPTPPG